MKLHHLLLLTPLVASQLSFAARPDVPPTDDNARSCLAALSIQFNEKIAVKVLAEPRRFGRPEHVDLVLSDVAKGNRRILRTAQLDFGRVRSLESFTWSLILDAEIKTQNFTLAQYKAFKDSRDEIGEVDIAIGPREISPTRFTGEDKLLVGDVAKVGKNHLLVLTEHPTSRYDSEDGDVSGQRYRALKLPGFPEVGMKVKKQRPTEFTIEQYSYSGTDDVPALLGHAVFEGEFSNDKAVRYGAKIVAFTPREAEPKELVQIWMSNYRGKHERRRTN